MIRVLVIVVLVAGGIGAAGGAEESWRIRGEYVEAKEGDQGRVVIRLPDGTLVTLPLSAFDEAGQASIRKRTAPPLPSAAAAGELSAPLAEDLAACRTAAEACDACRLFLANPATAAGDRAAIERRLRELEPRAERGELRHGQEWVTPAAAAKAAEEAEQFLVRATEMIRLGNLKVAEQEIRKASRSNPLDGRADFLLGLGFLVGPARDLDEAAAAFEAVVRREPTNGAAFNNLAICHLERRRSKAAAAAFRDAADNLADSQPVVANLALVIQMAANPRAGIAGNQLEEFTSLYHRLLQGRPGGAQPTAGGPTILLPDGTAIPSGVDLRNLMATGGAWELQGAATARRGWGIVVAPGYLLVPVDLPFTGGSLRVLRAEPPAPGGLPDEGLEAKVVAASSAAGVALVRCESLDRSPLRFATDAPVVESELLGVTGGVRSGERSRVVALDAPPGKFVYSATLARWTNGPPLMDARGRVVGIAVPSPRLRASGCRLAFALDLKKILPFVRDQLPDFEPASSDSEPLGWEEVARVAEAGTVRVVARPIASPTAP